MPKPKAQRKTSPRQQTEKRSLPNDRSSFPIVGIGASAGGLEACTDLIKKLPADTGMAFVLVQHLDPQHESALTQILARSTSMRVREASNNLRVKPNCFYVITPNTSLLIRNGVIQLRPRNANPGPQRSIDLFFNSLAQDQKTCAIGIILSGTGTDGTEGLETIKSEGGITFAQDSSAKYDSMPKHADAAGCVDYVLPPHEIARQLSRISKHPYVKGQSLPAELENPEAVATKNRKRFKKQASAHAEELPVAPHANEGFKKIVLLLRNHSGVDFTLYRSGTILRRTHRRMALNKQQTMSDYARFLERNSKELEARYSDVIIGVTSFFRDPEAFDVLKTKVFPKLVGQSDRGSGPVRVWTLGCSTGQEAYSIAMAYTEFADKVPRAPKIQVFATDIHNTLLDKARHGLYLKTICGNMPPERLKRFFVEEQGGYRIVKSLRDLCVFARQNILCDPPFSRLDLISCRNMLIYIEPESQKKIFPTFHYTLKPGGFLFLGTSESVGSFTNLFATEDKKHKIYSKIAGPGPAYHLPVSKGYSAHSRTEESPRKVERPREPVSGALNAQREADRILASRFGPASVLIDDTLDIIQFRGPTSHLLSPSTGKASLSIFKMAAPSLVAPLRAVINEAKKTAKSAFRKNVLVAKTGRPQAINIEVTPLRNLKQPCYLIILEEVAAGPSGSADVSSTGGYATRAGANAADNREGPRRVEALEEQLAESREYAESFQAQHEVANEELQAALEEVQSSNEELQSINEELETSKEELESTNEELTTVNEEMAYRNVDLNRLNNDLKNFHVSINTAIILLSDELIIRRFTPLALSAFNLLPTDVGRYFGAVRHNLELAGLEDLLADVIKTITVQEREVQDKSGNWYLLRARPYLTLDNKIDGAVLMLTDINVLKRARDEVTEAKEYAEAIVAIVPPLLILDPNLRVLSANESFFRHFKLLPAQIEDRLIYELDNGQWNIPKMRKLLEDILPRNSFFKNFEVVHEFAGLGSRRLYLSAQRLDHVQKILLFIDDITERTQLEEEVRRSELRYRRLFEATKDGLLLLDPKTQTIADANPALVTLVGLPHSEVLGKKLWEIGLPSDENAAQSIYKVSKTKAGRPKVISLEIRRGERELKLLVNRHDEDGKEMIQCHLRDVTERNIYQRELAEKARLLDLTQDAIIVRGTDDNITLWNKGAENLFGWACQEVIGKGLHPLLQTEFPKPREQIIAELHKTGSFTGEVVQVARDGRRVSSHCRWVLDQETNSILTSYTDITELQKIQTELRNAHSRLTDRAGQLEKAVVVRTAELTAINKQLEAFVYSIAHDLRAPLRSMEGFAAMLVEEAGPVLSDTARDYAHRIRASAQFMDALLKDLIAYGGIAEQKVELCPVALENLVTMAVESLKIQITGRGASVALAGPWPNVMAHEGTLGPVLVNSLENALKFVPAETKPLIQVKTEEQGEVIRIWVEDNGIGIAPEHQKEVFKLFTRLRGDSYEGTGVGLAIVKKGLERMSGQSGVDSDLHKGSRFWIELKKA